jgi:hypothetical protein
MERDYLKQKLRIGIMASDTNFPEWIARCIEYLFADKHIEISLLIFKKNTNSIIKQNRILKVVRTILSQVFLHKLFYRFFMQASKMPHMKMRDLTPNLSKVPSIHCETIKRGKYSECFCENDIEEIKKFNLDIILRFAFGIIKGEIHTVPRYGVWSFHHDNEQKYRGVPSCFWEIYYGDSETGAILQRLTEKLDGGIILKKGFLKTINYSWADNQARVYLESARWPLLVCKDIVNDAADYLNAPPSTTKAPVYYMPINREMLYYCYVILINIIRQHLKRFFVYKYWNIGICSNAMEDIVEKSKNMKIKWLPNPDKGSFSADGFAISIDKKKYILWEKFERAKNKGEILYYEIEEDKIIDSGLAISLPFHTAYPYLIEFQNEIFLLPETHENNEAALYRALHFPDTWVKACTLLTDVKAVDSTLFFYNNKWWLFCAHDDNYPDANLYIYYASDVFGPYMEHTSNPVKTDVRSSRPAGTPFVYNGTLLRPAQDCSRDYGSRIVLNKVNILTPTMFREEAAGFIEPDRSGPYPDGLHTISFSKDGFISVDGAVDKVELFQGAGTIVRKVIERIH